MSQIPMRTFGLPVEGEDKPVTFIFRANHRAWHTLEQASGKGLVDWLGQLGTTKLLGPWHELAWALSATHRNGMAQPPSYEEFLDMLPGTGSGWAKFAIMLSDLVHEAFPSEKKAPALVTTTTKKKARRAA